MIDVQKALRNMPHFDTFCSVDKLHQLVERLATSSRFDVKVAGISTDGAPIHHVRVGSGSVKVLLVAFPHCMEPVGGLTVYSLMTLLQQGNEELLAADVEWNIVPCIDPDGARKNESWSQSSFTLDSFMRNFYMQAAPEQVDVSFPIAYKKLQGGSQSLKEGIVLKKILDEVRPDLYFSLHNYCCVGGVFYLLSRNLDSRHYQEIYRFLDGLNFPIEKRPALPQLAHFSDGILEMNSFRKSYDYPFWRKLSVIPQVEMQNGWLRKEERRKKRTMDSYREDP